MSEFFQSLTDFDIGRILNIPWYSLVWFDNFEDTSLIGCSSYQFTKPLDSDQISYEYTYNYPDIQGPLNLGIYSLAPTDENRIYDVVDNDVDRKFNVLDYAEDYSWVVIGDTGKFGDPWVDIIVQSLDNDNSAGVAKAEERAAEYGLEARHDVNQSGECQYDANREELEADKAEQEEDAEFFGQVTDFDVERILGGNWYSVVWFDNDEDEPYGCSSYQFIQSPDSNEISYDYSYFYPDIDGSLYSGDYTLAPTDDSHVFDVTDNPVWNRKFNILAYDEDYNWVVFGDTGASLFGDPWVDLIVRSLDNDNSAGVAKAEEEAAKYGFGARHDVNHSDTCQYVDQVFGN